jgi:putative addiction module component (TIGR02574 family)
MSQALPEFNFDHLTPPQRLELITQLWDSMPDDMQGLPVPDWHREEIERRLAAADAAPQGVISWDEARRQLRGES